MKASILKLFVRMQSTGSVYSNKLTDFAYQVTHVASTWIYQNWALVWQSSENIVLEGEGRTFGRNWAGILH